MKRFLAVIAFGLPLAANPIAVGVILVPINPGSIAGAGGAQWTSSVTDDATHEFTIVEPHLPVGVVVSLL